MRTHAAGDTWVGRPLDELLDVIASRSAPVGGGGSAAIAAGLAAALLERCALEAGAESAHRRIAGLRGRLGELVELDATALVALMHGSGDGGHETAGLLAEAASAPMRALGAVAGELAGLAADLARHGTPWLRAEARCGQILASASADAAAAIVAANGHAGRARPETPNAAATAVVDLTPDAPGSGPRWGMQSDELNATLLTWPGGHEIAAHANDEREVLLIVLAGSARVLVDGTEHQLAPEQLLLIPRGSVRAITAGPEGVRYLSTHRRRGPLLPTSQARP